MVGERVAGVRGLLASLLGASWSSVRQSCFEDAVESLMCRTEHRGWYW